MRSNAHFCLLGTLALIGLIGCGAAEEGEASGVAGVDELGDLEVGDLEIGDLEIGELEQGLSANCGDFSPQQTFTGSVPRTTASAAVQSRGCESNSFVFDINRYDDGRFLTPSVNPAVFPDTESQCTGTTAQQFVWERTANGVIFLGSNSESGSFDPVLGCFLSVPSPVNLAANRDYRFGVTVRGPGNALRDLTVFSPISP